MHVCGIQSLFYKTYVKTYLIKKSSLCRSKKLRLFRKKQDLVFLSLSFFFPFKVPQSSSIKECAVQKNVSFLSLEWIQCASLSLQPMSHAPYNL
eukprot:gene7858-5485_t